MERPIREICYQAAPDETTRLLCIGPVDIRLLDALNRSWPPRLTDAQREECAGLFGPDYQERLRLPKESATKGERLHYLAEAIFDDDSLYIIARKVFRYIQEHTRTAYHPHHLYLWSAAPATPARLRAFMQEAYVSAHSIAEFQEAVRATFGVDVPALEGPAADPLYTYEGALAYLEGLHLQTLYDPLEWRFYDIWGRRMFLRAHPFSALPPRLDTRFVGPLGEEQPQYQRKESRAFLTLAGAYAAAADVVLYVTTATDIADHAALALPRERRAALFYGIVHPLCFGLDRLDATARAPASETADIDFQDPFVGFVHYTSPGTGAATEPMVIGISQLTLRVDPLKHHTLDLTMAFDHIPLGYDVPYLEWRQYTRESTIQRRYRLFKDRLGERAPTRISRALLHTWMHGSSTVPYAQMKGVHVELVAKIAHPRGYVTVTLLESPTVALLISFRSPQGQQPYTLDDVHDVLRRLQAWLDAITGYLDPSHAPVYHRVDTGLVPLPFYMHIEHREERDRFKGTLTLTMPLTTTPQTRDIVEWLQGMKPYVKALSDRAFRFIRVNGYDPTQECIELVDSLRRYQSRETILQTLQTEFNYTRAVAEERYADALLQLQQGHSATPLTSGALVDVDVPTEHTLRSTVVGVSDLAVLFVLSRLFLLAWHQTPLPRMASAATTATALTAMETRAWEEKKKVLTGPVASVAADDDDDLFADLDLFEDMPPLLAPAAVAANTPPSTTASEDALQNVGALSDKDQRRVINDYFLSSLQRADRELFTADYSRACSVTPLRQPVVLTAEEKARQDREFPRGYTNAIQTGSTPEAKAQNVFICPRYWCPLSKVALSADDLRALGHRCPGPKYETPITIESEYWNGDEHYVGIHKRKHPRGFDWPCCVKSPKAAAAAAAAATETHTASESAAPVTDDATAATASAATNEHALHISCKPFALKTPKDVHAKDRYILADKPAEPLRFGVLPPALAALLGSQLCEKLVKDNRVCFTRMGVPVSSYSFLHSVAACLNYSGTLTQFIDDIEANMAPPDYLFLNNGNTAKTFAPVHLGLADLRGPDFDAFVAAFTGPAYATYIRQFHLQPVASALAAQERTWDVYREFLLFESRRRFFAYLRSDAPQDHETLLDLFHPRYIFQNPDRLQFLVLDLTDETTPRLACPRYIPMKTWIDTRRPVSVILRQASPTGGIFYEPLVRVRFHKGNCYREGTFLPRDVPFFRRLLDGVALCVSPDARAYSIALKCYAWVRSHIASIVWGVIDISYKCRGFLAFKQKNQHPLWIPLPIPSPLISSSLLSSYTYIHHLVGHVSQAPDEIYDELLSQPWWPADARPTFPGPLDAIDAIGAETGTTVADSGLMTYYDRTLTALRALFRQPALHRRVTLLHHYLHPYTPDEKRAVLADIVRTLAPTATEDQRALLVRDLYTTDTRYLFARCMKQTSSRRDIVLDDHDVNTGVLDHLYAWIDNPYRAVYLGAEDHVRYIPVEASRRLVDLVFDVTATEEIYPARWHRFFRDFRLDATPERTSPDRYTAASYEILVEYAVRATKQKYTLDQIRRYIRDKHIEFATADVDAHWERQIRYNPRFGRMARGRTPSVDAVAEITAHPDYLWGLNEWFSVARLLGISIMIVGRQHPQLMPEGYLMIDPMPSYVLYLHEEREATRCLYRAIVDKTRHEIVHAFNDLPIPLQRMLVDTAIFAPKTPQ